jgi:hypothetical protein
VREKSRLGGVRNRIRVSRREILNQFAACPEPDLFTTEIRAAVR